MKIGLIKYNHLEYNYILLDCFITPIYIYINGKYSICSIYDSAKGI